MDYHGSTPLHLACQRGHSNVAVSTYIMPFVCVPYLDNVSHLSLEEAVILCQRVHSNVTVSTHYLTHPPTHPPPPPPRLLLMSQLVTVRKSSAIYLLIHKGFPFLTFIYLQKITSQGQGVKCPIFSYFLKNSYFFLFFTEVPTFSYFSAVFSTFILFSSQKLREASEIRRVSCSGESHSCEIATL